MSGPEQKLSEVFAVINPDLLVDTLRVTPTIYEELDSRFDQFKNRVLVAEYAFSENWPTWERHPAGDEIVVLLSGQAEMVMRKNGEDESTALTQPGSFVVVPAGSQWQPGCSSSLRGKAPSIGPRFE